MKGKEQIKKELYKLVRTKTTMFKTLQMIDYVVIKCLGKDREKAKDDYDLALMNVGYNERNRNFMKKWGL